MAINKVAIITGASAGVGRAITRIFAAHGYNLGLIARDNERLLAAKKEVEALGVKALIFPLDVTDYEGMEEALRQTESRFGPIGVWVNDAMLTVYAEVRDMKPEEYERVTNVSYLGYVRGTMVALKSMWERNEGIIIQVGSIVSYRGIPLQSAYSGAKFAIRGFTDSLRTELIHNKKNIRLTMVQLPSVNTPQFSWAKLRIAHNPQPVPPIFQPELIARAVYYVTEHKKRELVVTGNSLLSLWANKFFPGLGDKYLAKTGYKGEQTDEPVEPNHTDNLWHPVPGDFAARGKFDKQAKQNSLFFRFRTFLGF